MEAQLQIRQNALEVQDYMRDLLDWQKTMNNKATSSSKQSAECLDIPAVRGRAGSSSVRAPAEAMQQPALLPRGTQSPHNGVSAAHPASHTYKNYSKWDKFDVDAALEEQDLLKPDITRPSKHQQPSQSSQAVLPAQQQPAAAKATAAAAAKATAAAAAKATAAAAAAASVSNQTKAAGKAAAGSDRAAALKDQGNKLFQAGYYDEAIDCYNQSIDILPTSVAFANRAMALLKQKKYQQVDQDCTAALLLDAGYVKALHRRGTARLHMGQLLAAAMDFESALCLEPHNKAIQMDRDDALAKHCQAENINTQSSSWTSIPVTVHQPLQQQAQQQPNRQPTQQPTQQPKLQQQKQKDFADGPQTPGALPSGASSSSVIHRPIRRASPGSSTGGSSRVSPRDDRQAAATAAATTSAAQLAAARLTSSIRPPKTSSDFEAAWRSFKGDLQLQVSSFGGLKCSSVYCCMQQLFSCSSSCLDFFNELLFPHLLLQLQNAAQHLPFTINVCVVS
jgi:Meckel syndrome type 1 protein